MGWLFAAVLLLVALGNLGLAKQWRYVCRAPTEFEVLKKLLLSEHRSQPVATTTALCGGGDFGKRR